MTAPSVDQLLEGAVHRRLSPEEVAASLAQSQQFTEEAIASVRDVAPDDAEGFRSAVMLAGRDYGPGMLWDWWADTHCFKVDQEALRKIVADVWSSADFPERNLSPRSVWVDLFRQADYPVPSEPVTLYRGSTPGRRRGMAWTTDLDRARWFASSWRANVWQGGCNVYTVTATPDVILCDLDSACEDGGRKESEIVVDSGLLGRTELVR